MHLHLRGAQRRLNAGDLLGIDIAFVVHAQYLRQGTTQLQVAAAQLAQRLLEQPLLSDTDTAAVGPGRDSNLNGVPIQRLLACAPVEAARLHKSSDGRQVTLVAVQQTRIGPGSVGCSLTQIQRHGRGEPRRRHDTHVHEIGTYQVVIGKEVAQELVEHAYGGLRHAGVDGIPAAGNLAG